MIDINLANEQIKVARLTQQLTDTKRELTKLYLSHTQQRALLIQVKKALLEKKTPRGLVVAISRELQRR